MKGSEGRRFAFEETAYLLLFGELPTAAQLEAFCQQLASYRTLPTNFFRDVIMKAPPRDLMNTMQRGILTLFCYDDKPNDIGLENVLRQCLQLMSNMPVLAIYAYQAWRFRGRACLSTCPSRSCPPRRTSCGCCGRTAATPIWRPGPWTWP